jgi:hypothetical protein
MSTDFTLSLDEDDFEQAMEAESVVAKVRSTPTTKVPTVRHEVRGQRAEGRRDYLTRDPSSWTWDDIRNYVVGKIEARDRATGTALPARQEGKEFGIFSAFAGRHGSLAGPIAVFAFETSATPGYWRNAPIGIGRFAKNSDPYFASVIAEKIDAD